MLLGPGCSLERNPSPWRERFDETFDSRRPFGAQIGNLVRFLVPVFGFCTSFVIRRMRLRTGNGQMCRPSSAHVTRLLRSA